MITFYGYKKCSTCRKAELALSKAGKAYTFVDITEHPPTTATLKAVAQQAGRELTKMFNTSGVVYREQNIKAKLAAMSHGDMLKMLAAEGRLIKRPIVTDGTTSTVGFDEAEFKSAWR